MKTIKFVLFFFLFLSIGIFINTGRAEAVIICSTYDPTFSETWQESTCKARANDTYYCSASISVTDNSISGGCGKRSGASTCGGNSSCGRTLATDVTCKTFDRNEDGQISRSECVETQHYEWNFDGCQCEDIGDNDNGGGGGGGGGGGNTCSCTDWNNQSCGAGSCGAGSVRQTRTCTNNCADEARCVQKDWCTNPDLDITAFRFQGGREKTQTSATITIKNSGNEAITQNFNVIVYNKRFGNNRDSKVWTVTQRVNSGERISHTFTGLQIPSAGDYTALAVVDTSDKVNESDEGNNNATDDYVATEPPRYDITGLVFIDEDDSNSFNAGDVRVGNVTIARRQGTNNFANGVKTCNQANCTGGRQRGEYNMFDLNQGTYDLKLDTTTLPANTSLDTGVTNPRTNINLDQNRTVNFRLIRGNIPQFTIAGGVFLDGDGDGIKQSGEPYTTGGANSPTRTITSGAQNATAGSFNFTGYTESGSPYTLSMQAPPAGYRVTWPANGTRSVNLTVGAGCAVNPHWTCAGAGNITGLNFGIQPITQADKWFQTIGGDVRADNDFKNIVPGTNYLSIGNAKMTYGLVIGEGLDIGGAARANQPGWFVDNSRFAPNNVKTSYDQVVANLKRGGVWDSAQTMFSGGDRPCSGPNQADGECILKTDITPGTHLYKAAKNTVTLKAPDYTFGAGDYIFVIDGNLRIENNITVPVGTTVLFVVNGSITVANNVTDIAGIFSADNNFTVQNPGGGVAGVPLEIQGTVITNAALGNRQNPPQTAGTLINNRDLLAGNDTTPSIVFTYRPDFVLNAPEVFKYPTYKIQEVAPGEQ